MAKTRNTVKGFNNRLNELMADSNMTITELAKKVGISRTNMYGYLMDGVMPSCHVLVEIAKAFDVSTDYLLGLEKR